MLTRHWLRFSAGHVVFSEVMTLPDGRSKGCGCVERSLLSECRADLVNSVVEFSSPQEAQRAIRDLNDQTLMGRPLFIREVRLHPFLLEERAIGQPHRIARTKLVTVLLPYSNLAEALEAVAAVAEVTLAWAIAAAFIAMQDEHSSCKGCVLPPVHYEGR